MQQYVYGTYLNIKYFQNPAVIFKYIRMRGRVKIKKIENDPSAILKIRVNLSNLPDSFFFSYF